LSFNYKNGNINLSNDKSFNLNAYLPPNLKNSDAGIQPKTPMAINTTTVLKRVSAQKGCFTVHGTEDDSIDTYLKDDEDFQMITIKIKSQEHRKEMIKTLSKLGIDEEFIYQDLDSLCNRIKREYGIDS